MSAGEQATGTWAALRQRKLVQWALAYAAAAWVLLQVLGLSVDSYDWPGWIMRLAIGAALLGFVVTLVLAWFHGERGQQRVSAAELLVLALVLSIGGALLWRFDPSAQQVAPGSESRPGTSTTATAGIGLQPVDGKSIAVLPFENLSEDKSNAYFADGMQDEIITRLAKIGQLKVISRSSTQRYRTKDANVADIARELGVANLVEGSVQKVGNRVRINVQLIAAQSDEHLWAELYDRDLIDIFAVQSEVATNIARTLEATLSGSERQAISGKPTDKPAAYDAYLRGLDYGSRAGQNPKDQRAAARYFAEAVRLDPQFARAWAQLSQINAALVFTRNDASPAREEAARTAAEIATRLDPSAAETLLANAYYRYHIVRDYEGARALFEQLRKEVPSSSEAAAALARIARRQGRWKESLDLFEAASKLNPRDAQLWMERAWTYSMLRDHKGTRSMIDRALEITPSDPDVLSNEAYYFLKTGNPTAAFASLDRVPEDRRHVYAGLEIILLTFERRFAEAIRLAERTLAHPEWNPQNDMGVTWDFLGFLRSLAGDAQGARMAYTRGKADLLLRQQQQPRNEFIVNALALCEAGLGNKQAALREAARAVSMMRASEDSVFGPVAEQGLASIEAMVGEPDRAIARIERLLVTPYGAFPLTQAELRLDPVWDPLRSHPRFKAIVESPEPKTIYE